MYRQVSEMDLYHENLAYAGTGGVSENARSARLLPAFKDVNTGRVELSLMEDGRLAPVHMICRLPLEWAKKLDARGRVAAVREGIIAGFVRDEVFYTRDEAAALVA